MRKRKVYFIISFSLVCLVLYFANYYLNSVYNWECCQLLLRNEDKLSIPSIVVYSNNNILQPTKTCGSDNDAQEIPNATAKLQKVGDTSLYLYSAYWDKRLVNGNKFIRIIAISRGNFNEKACCRIWSKGQNSFAVDIEPQELWINSWDSAMPSEYYRPLLLSCAIKKDITPIAVSVTMQLCQKPDNVMWLNETKVIKPMKEFVVCLKPLNFTEDITAKLLEWLELQFLLGANKVAVYVYNLPYQALRVLKYYEQLGKVSLKHLTFPKYQNDTKPSSLEQQVWQKRRYEMVIYNDCFYSHVASHRMVINLDLDEAIVPRKQDSWMGLFKQVSTQNVNIYQFASISAANVYFFDSFATEHDVTIPKHFYMLRHLYRSANFTPPGFAQKSFFLTNSTLAVTNHYALRALYPNVRTNTALSKNLVQMHHYRSSCPPKMEKECEDNYMKFRTKDPIMLKYKTRLKANVNRKVKELNLTKL